MKLLVLSGGYLFFVLP